MELINDLKGSKQLSWNGVHLIVSKVIKCEIAKALSTSTTRFLGSAPK